MVDNPHADVLYLEATPPATTLQGIVEQIAAMRAEFRADLGALRTEFRADSGALRTELGALRQELQTGLQAVNDRITLTNAQVMNLKIRKGNRKRVAEGQSLMPVHKVVPGSGFEKALTLRGGTNVRRSDLEDRDTQIGNIPDYPDSLQHKEILDLIIYYNDDFGIENHMDLDTRRRRVHAYLFTN